MLSAGILPPFRRVLCDSVAQVQLISGEHAMRTRFVLLAVLAFLVLAGVVWRFSALTGESAGQITSVDAEQATVDRTRGRTLRESRMGV